MSPFPCSYPLIMQDQVQGDDEQLEYILDNDLTWELEIARRKKRWRLKEDELRAEKTRCASRDCPI